MHELETNLRAATKASLRRLAPRVHALLHRGFVPGAVARRVLQAVGHLQVVGREASEWAHRTFVATPAFLSRCAVHGERIGVDRMPYVNGDVRIEVGDDFRISGKLSILGSIRREGVLRVGNGVFFGHDCVFGIAERIEIGNHVSVGGGTYVADTAGHSHARLDVPIWQDPTADVAPVVIEDNVHIGTRCIILKGVRIGARAIVGAGSVVRSDVPPGAVVVGNPARVAGWRKLEHDQGAREDLALSAARHGGGHAAPRPAEAPR